MKKLLSCLIALVICIAVISASAAGGFSNDADAIEKAAKSVLKIYVFESAFDEEPFATGSGFVAFDSSTLITNYHVIDGASVVIASDDDDNTYELDKVLCADKEADIAILRFSKPTKLKALELYPDNQLKRGSPVVAIGSPKGLKNTVSTGIVSYQYDWEGIPEIQITAPISPGSSGGALFNDEGKVIGVTSAAYRSEDEYGNKTDAQNLNFAVNIAVAQAMYNAWDGKVYTLRNHKSTAKMDFSGVYKHDSKVSGESTDITTSPVVSSSNETWVCLICGKENTTKYCQECGAEKPYWVCSCGRVNSSNKFCGECGNSCAELINSFNNAISLMGEKNFVKAAEILESLGQFNSGSFETDEGNHIEARNYIGKAYYDLAVYLQSTNGAHEAIVAAFEKAGDYGDAQEQIVGENARYYKSFYDAGIEKQKVGQYDEAIECFLKAGDYSDAAHQIVVSYYAKGLILLKRKDYEAAREAFSNVGANKNAQNKILESYYLEAEDKLNEHAYEEAMALFEKANGYSDSKDRISEIYYIQGIEALDAGDTDKAKEYFTKAKDYEDAPEKIKQIDEGYKESIYQSAMKAYEEKDYNLAIEQFLKISGYRDADEKATSVKIDEIRSRFQEINTDPQMMTSREYNILHKLISDIFEYKSNAEANSLYKMMNYCMAKYHQVNDSNYMALTYYHVAGDYLDAPEQLLACKIIQFNSMLEQDNVNQAIEYYLNELVPAGYKDEFYLVDVSSKGTATETVLQLIKPLGIKAKIPDHEDVYKEEYIPYVQGVEEFLGLTADGRITVEEYCIIQNVIYPNCSSNKVKDLVEKLADLSYLSRLPEEHSTYIQQFASGIKKAEKALGLKVDGIITPDEYDVISEQQVDPLAAPENLKATVKNDTVTLSWSPVPGANFYEIKIGSITTDTITTNKTTWTHQNVKTGEKARYSVRAKKYTIESDATRCVVDIPTYYQPMTVSELKKNNSKYMNKNVKIDNLKVDSWWIRDPKGNYTRSSSDANMASDSEGYLVLLLCHSGSNYIEIVIEAPQYWGWKKYELYNNILTKAKTISITGMVSRRVTSWGNHGDIPSISIDYMSWSNR